METADQQKKNFADWTTERRVMGRQSLVKFSDFYG